MKVYSVYQYAPDCDEGSVYIGTYATEELAEKTIEEEMVNYDLPDREKFFIRTVTVVGA